MLYKKYRKDDFYFRHSLKFYFQYDADEPRVAFIWLIVEIIS